MNQLSDPSSSHSSNLSPILYNHSLINFSTISYSFKQAASSSSRDRDIERKWLLFQLPGRQRYVEFGNFQTSAVSVMVHSLLYFSLVCVFLLALKIHIYIG
ncbi:hypothetical protein V5N11_001484 [Cardamine amara subsp. amara]|uniref:Uncharacterized protein n=1 Tax=Cardamine amara subsp. amara TaxID=228776 RepID=A0ABD0ZQK7_CARAN